MSKVKEQWLNRPMVVTVKTYCEHCKGLHEGVEKRDWSNYLYGSYNRQVKMTSCKPCFEAAVKKAQMEQPWTPEGY